ncbi:F-box/RNI superfamily protein, putative [Medicago truncatula]|uniref:F-box/RNI superfamily protein, putative n=1 Tax=Medicago truncatula TaxID=3880 RepID=A0A072TYB2_MEDTR|nr:F-box/RNI superfamily protein, putative [Medicago truncatula]
MASQRSILTLDRISALPDSVICHILSFLSTKQASSPKDGNPLWLSVLTLDFDNFDFEDFATFRHFAVCLGS